MSRERAWCGDGETCGVLWRDATRAGVEDAAAQPFNISAAALVGGQAQPLRFENPLELRIFELPFTARLPRPVLNGELTRGLTLNRTGPDRSTRSTRSRLCGKPAGAALLRSVC